MVLDMKWMESKPPPVSIEDRTVVIERFRPEEAGLGVGEGGGGAGKDARARNRGMVAGGGRSKEGGDDGAGARVPLGSDRSEEEERNDK